MNKNIRIKKAIFISLLLISAIAVSIISIFWIYDEIKGSKKEKDELHEKSIAFQKEKLQREVEIALDYIAYRDSTNINLGIKELQNETLDYLSTIRFGYGGYIFVNKIDGQALIFDGKKLTEHRNNLGLKDSRGTDIFAPQIEAFHNRKGAFIQYYFKRIGGSKEEPKLSYTKGYHKWGWIIGAGNYLVDIDKEIKQVESELSQRLQTRVLLIILLFVILLLIIFLMSYSLSKYVKREFNVFETYYKNSVPGELIDLGDLSIKELEDIAQVSNHMINEIEEKNTKLKESEEKFRTFIENSADAIFICDKKGNYFYVNKMATNLLGYTQDELLKMNIKDLSPKNEVDHYVRLFKSIEINKNLFIELNLLNKKKEIVPVDLNAVTLPNGTIFGSCRNISKRKETETELHKHQTQLEEIVKQRTKELEDKNEELERFNKLFIGREFRIKELKERLKRYEKGNKK